eukprot:7208290-Pyramimonas_sp.AAC.1
MVDNALKTCYHNITVWGSKPTPMYQDFAVRALRSKVCRAICNEGANRMPLEIRAGQPATAGQPAASCATTTVEI